MSDYCQESDLYDFGVTRGAIPNPARSVAEVVEASSTFQLGEHGFSAGTPVMLHADGLGSLMPPPLVEGTPYYALPTGDNTFQVAATEGGPAIELTGPGARIMAGAALPKAAAIRWASAIIEDMLPAHVVPLTAPYPPVIVVTTAELAANKLLSRTGSASAALMALVDAANKRIERWAKGVPIRGENAPTTHTNLAVAASLPVSDARGWHRFGGL